MSAAPATLSLHASDGRRKYVAPDERTRIIPVAESWTDSDVGSFCLLIVFTGCRISEALAVTRANLDPVQLCVTLRSLKKRNADVFRDIPLPKSIFDRLIKAAPKEGRIWTFSRSHAWRQIKRIMREAGILKGPHQTPKGLRHGFGIHAIHCGVPLHMVQRWLGHASLATTAIYAQAIGAEERELAARMWS